MLRHTHTNLKFAFTKSWHLRQRHILTYISVCAKFSNPANGHLWQTIFASTQNVGWLNSRRNSIFCHINSRAKMTDPCTRTAFKPALNPFLPTQLYSDKHVRSFPSSTISNFTPTWQLSLINMRIKSIFENLKFQSFWTNFYTNTIL